MANLAPAASVTINAIQFGDQEFNLADFYADADTNGNDVLVSYLLRAIQ